MIMKKILCLVVVFTMMLTACSKWNVEIVDPREPIENEAELIISEEEKEENPEEPEKQPESEGTEQEEQIPEGELLLDLKEEIGRILKEEHQLDFESVVSAASNGEKIFFVAGVYPEESGHHIYKDYLEMLFSINYDGTNFEGPYITKEAMSKRYSIVFDNEGTAFALMDNIPVYSAEEKTEPFRYCLMNVETGEEYTIIEEKDIDGTEYDSVTGQWVNNFTFIDSIFQANDGNWYITMSNYDQSKARVVVLNSDFEEEKRFEGKNAGNLFETASGNILCVAETKAEVFDIEKLEPTGKSLSLPEEQIIFIGRGNSEFDFIAATYKQVVGYNTETGEEKILLDFNGTENELTFATGVFVSENGRITVI